MQDIVSQFLVTDEEVASYMKLEGICSGKLISFCRKLAFRASIFEKQKTHMVSNKFAKYNESQSKKILKIFLALFWPPGSFLSQALLRILRSH